MNIPDVRGEDAQKLERGTAVYRFNSKNRPECGKLFVRRETSHIVWQTNHTKEIIASLLEVKDIKRGKNCKDFEKWPEDCSKYDSACCFTFFYTTEFKYKTLSVAAISDKECLTWFRGIQLLVKEAKTASYNIYFERLLRTLFYNEQNQHYMIGLREFRNIVNRMHFKEKDTRLRDLIQLFGEGRDTINFDQFCDSVKNLIWEEQKVILSDNSLMQYTVRVCSLPEFQAFLSEQQKESEEVIAKASDVMRSAVDDRVRDLAQPHLLQDEFLQYLFSRDNQIFDSRHNQVNQDMTRPLSHYFMSSSHNTYLTDKQIGGLSSVEAYVRALRQGCRCIELDTWPEKDGKIYIYHGYAFTTKILLNDVLLAIKENAFISSHYPVVLSIEDHCTLPLQREMARLMREVFGAALVTEPFKQGETVAPSPQQLMGKILVKHRKLAEGCTEEATVTTNNKDNYENKLRRGVAYRRHPVLEDKWLKHYFVLTPARLYYSHACEEEEEESEVYQDPTTPHESRHLSESWYHSRPTVTRRVAEEMLSRYSHLGNGTFLVRKSENFVGDFTLSFWYKGSANHCRIHSHQETDRTRYYLKEDETFDSLFRLVENYKTNPIHSQSVVSTLSNPVPQPDSYERMPWFHTNLDQTAAGLCLHRLKQDGVFVVRPSAKAANCFAVSFRACDEIKHCRIEQKEGVYTIGRAEFESLVELVDYYSHNPLYKSTKLKYPVPPSVLQSVLRQTPGLDEQQMQSSEALYVSNLRVEAKRQYTAKNVDELDFPKHAIITNVNQATQDWWKGDYGGRAQHYFPSSYVTVLPPDDSENHQLLGNLQQGSLDLLGASVTSSAVTSGCVRLIIKVKAGFTLLEIGFESTEEAEGWLKDIRMVITKDEPLELDVRVKERQRDVAKEISALVIYFETVTFNKNIAFKNGGTHNQISSFSELRMDKLMFYSQKLLEYHRVGFSRVYPKGTRVDSSNFNPMPMWAHGVQCVALNYQTGDKWMQINHGMFLQNGGCGYILRPDCHFEDRYDPTNPNSLLYTKPMNFSIKVLGARHILTKRKGLVSPNVEVEVLGCDYESNNRHSTSSIPPNGLCPVWNESFSFTVLNPSFALLRFVVFEEVVFGEQTVLAQATYPLLCLREGYRSVPLLNNFSEDLGLASLLVHYNIENSEVNGSNSTDVQNLVRRFTNF